MNKQIILILPYPVVSCRIMPYTVVSCRICRILPYPAVSCRILCILPYPAVFCRILPYPAVSCCILPYPAVSCRILPYPAVSCRILPYPAVSNTRDRESLMTLLYILRQKTCGNIVKNSSLEIYYKLWTRCPAAHARLSLACPSLWRCRATDEGLQLDPSTTDTRRVWTDKQPSIATHGVLPLLVWLTHALLIFLLLPLLGLSFSLWFLFCSLLLGLSFCLCFLFWSLLRRLSFSLCFLFWLLLLSLSCFLSWWFSHGIT